MGLPVGKARRMSGTKRVMVWAAGLSVPELMSESQLPGLRARGSFLWMSSRSLIVAVCSVVVKLSERRVLDMKLTDLGLLPEGAGEVLVGVLGEVGGRGRTLATGAVWRHDGGCV